MRFDVLVLGCGPAGAAVAMVLANGGAKVLVLERATASKWKPGEILDGSVIWPLREMHAHHAIKALGQLRSAGTMSIWGGVEASEIEGISSAVGGNLLVDRDAFEQGLREDVQNVVAAYVPYDAKIGITRVRQGFGVRWLGSKQQALCSIVVEATGRAAGALGQGHRLALDELVGLLAYVEAPREHHDTRLYIESSKDGWWYSVLLPNGKLVIAFMTDAKVARGGEGRRRSLFEAALSATTLTRSRIPIALEGISLRSAPANTSRRTALCGNNWLAVGDAASAYDPLAGQGVPGALARGAAAGRLILAEGSFMKAMNLYADAERSCFADYLQVRRIIYSRETRWKNYQFWQARREAISVASCQT